MMQLAIEHRFALLVLFGLRVGVRNIHLQPVYRLLRNGVRQTPCRYCTPSLLSYRIGERHPFVAARDVRCHDTVVRLCLLQDGALDVSVHLKTVLGKRLPSSSLQTLHQGGSYWCKTASSRAKNSCSSCLHSSFTVLEQEIARANIKGGTTHCRRHLSHSCFGRYPFFGASSNFYAIIKWNSANQLEIRRRPYDAPALHLEQPNPQTVASVRHVIPRKVRPETSRN